MSEGWDGAAERLAPPDDEPCLVVDVGGFEGPLDLLLDLARRQKVDLHEVSILALAEQYFAFVEAARALRLELAADYLVMAAWLAFLKSRLLLPAPPTPEGPSAAELAQALAQRLRRLGAIRDAARLLGERPQLGREIFVSGGTSGPSADDPRPVSFTASLHDLLAAYARQRRPTPETVFVIRRRPVWAIADARVALERIVGEAAGWFDLETHLLPFCDDAEMRASVLASFLSAALEMTREGHAALRQDMMFGPISLAHADRVAA